jgi:hypothetical protein
LDLILGNGGDGSFTILKETLASRTNASNKLIMNLKMNVHIHLGTQKVQAPQKLRMKIIDTTVCLMRISDRQCAICIHQPTEKAKCETSIIPVLSEQRNIMLHERSSASKRN